MAEIAILRRVRESQERARRLQARRHPRLRTAFWVGGVLIGACLTYNAVSAGRRPVRLPQEESGY